MAEERKRLLDREEPILPILNRNAPVLNRIRSNTRGETVGAKMGEVVGEQILEEDEMEVEKEASEIVGDFRRSLSATLGVDEDRINEEFLSEVAAMFSALEEDEVVVGEAEEKEEEDSDEDDSSGNGEMFSAS